MSNPSGNPPISPAIPPGEEPRTRVRSGGGPPPLPQSPPSAEVRAPSGAPVPAPAPDPVHIVRWKGVFGIDAKARKRARAAKAISDKALVEQKAKFADISRTAALVKRNYLKPLQSDSLDLGRLNAGTDFKAFAGTLKLVTGSAEGTAQAGDRSPQALDALEAKAEAYLAHHAAAAKPGRQETPEGRKKREICEGALVQVKHWRLAEKIESIGAPPWNEETQLRMQGTLAELAFESADLEVEDKSELLAGPEAAGVSASFWIKSLGAPKPNTSDKRLERRLFFKPMDGEAAIHGMPAGGSAPREVLGKEMGDRIGAMTGIDFGLPNCSMVGIRSDRLKKPEQAQEGLAVEENQATLFEPGRNLTGSLQEFLPNCTGLDSKLTGPGSDAFIRSIPKDQVQRAAIYDLLMLNQDRHGANFMVRPNAASPAAHDLIPIDQGLILPTADTFNARRAQMLAPHNILLAMDGMPGSDEKLDPELAEKLEGLDPVALEASMRVSIRTMDKVYPDAKTSEKVPEEAILRARRSAEFMKAAARELTVREMYNALAISAEDIFDTDERDREAGFRRAMDRAKQNVAAERELAEYGPEAINQMEVDLTRLGWNAPDFKTLAMQRDGADLLRIWKSGRENPAARRRLDRLMAQLPKPDADKVADLARRGGLTAAINRAQPMVANLQKDENRRLSTRLGAPQPATEAVLKTLDAYKSLGGDTLVASGDDALPFPDRMRAAAAKAYAALGGGETWRRFVAWAEKHLPRRSYKSLTPEQILTPETVASLKDWVEYQRQGGDKLFYSLGGGAEVPVAARLELFRSAKEREDGRKEAVDDVPPEDLLGMAISRIMERIIPIIDGLADAEQKRALRAKRDAVQEKLSSDDFPAAYKLAVPLNKEVLALLPKTKS